MSVRAKGQPAIERRQTFTRSRWTAGHPMEHYPYARRAKPSIPTAVGPAPDCGW